MTPQQLDHEIHKRGLTKTHAAEVLGISRNYLHAMLCGRRRVPEDRSEDMERRFKGYDEGRLGS